MGFTQQWMIWRRARWLLVAVPVVVIVVGAWSHRWTTEDAFIDFRVVRNILAGHGPVFNVGERVEVYSDPLWVAVLTVASGLFSFIQVEWWAVILGVSLTAVGVGLGARTALRLGERRGQRLVPIGMMCFVVVAAAWDFASSGLETGMVFGWLGVSWWLLERLQRQVAKAWFVAVVLGAGFTIRPDLMVFVAALMVPLYVAIRTGTHADGTRRWRPYVTVTIALAAVPVLSELFRVAYFGLLVSNTALVKSAFSTWWSQGWYYLEDFVGAYWLWIPLVVLLAVNGGRWWSQWRSGQRQECVLWWAPAAGGLLSVLYVVAIGGDFMHARFLLPGFFAIAMALTIDLDHRLESRIPLAAVAAWILVCLIFLRPAATTSIAAIETHHGVANERSFWVSRAQHENPVTLSDFSNYLNYAIADQWNRDAVLVEQGSLPHPKALLTTYVDFQPITSANETAATSRLPERIYVISSNIGIAGLRSAPSVYLFDSLSLANPIGSHFIVVSRTRPGHEKHVNVSWFVGRFTRSGTVVANIDSEAAADARHALSCQPIAGYLHNISAPWSWNVMANNFTHALSWTSMSFSPDPDQAEVELCH